MKTSFYIGAAVAAALSCSAVNAQVLGGNATGGLGGTLSGGLRDMNVITQGSGNGSFGADLDTGSHMGTLRRTTSGVAGRTRSVTEEAGGRTRSTLGKIKGKGEAAASTTAGTASDAASTARQIQAPQVDATSAATGSLASGVDVANNEASGTLGAAHQAQLLSTGAATPEVDSPELAPVQSGSAAKPQLTKLMDSGEVRQTEKETREDTSGRATPQSSLLSNGSLGGQVDSSQADSSQGAGNSESFSLPVAQGEATGSGRAGGNANASKREASASAEADGSASASLRR